jgi:hypothetical protein
MYASVGGGREAFSHSWEAPVSTGLGLLATQLTI